MEDKPQLQNTALEISIRRILLKGRNEYMDIKS